MGREEVSGPEGDPDGRAPQGEQIHLAARYLAARSRWDHRLDEALAALGRVACADRVVLVEVAGGQPSDGLILREWRALGPASTPRVDDPQALYAVLRAVWAGLLAGRPVRTNASDASPEIATIMQRQGIRSILALSIEAGSRWQGYVRMDRFRPRSGWGEEEVGPLVEAGRLLGWAVEGWLAESELRSEVERYRSLVEETPGITYEHTDGEPKRMLYMSPHIEEILGYPTDAWLREEAFPWTIIHPEDRLRIEAIDALGPPPVIEYRMISRDGRVVWFCDSSALGRDEGGRIVHRGILVDVTSLREADRAIHEGPAARAGAARVVRAALLDPGLRSSLGPHAIRIVRAASEYLREHLGERVDRAALSHALAVSPDYLGRMFKAQVGISPHRFLVRLRLEAARDLLRETDLTVTQIAWRVGFGSTSYFVTTFRAHTGLTPLQWRRRSR